MCSIKERRNPSKDRVDVVDVYLKLSFAKGDWESWSCTLSGWRRSLDTDSGMGMWMMLELPCLPMVRLSSIQMPVLVLTCLALVSPLPPAQGKGGFKCSAGNLQHWSRTVIDFQFQQSGISKNICLLDNYSKFELPITEGVNKIYVSIDIDEVLRINDKDYSITFATYFNVEWTEHRLFVDPELEVWNHLHNISELLV